MNGLMLRGLAIVAFLLCIAPAGAASVADDPPPTLADACGSEYEEKLTAQTFWMQTADGVRLYAVEAGSGKTTIVLAHGGSGDLCDTLPYATQLIAAGYRIVTLDFRGSGRSGRPAKNWLALGRDFAAAVAHARATGAERVFLVGHSRGGAAIVQNTSALRVEGRISLSGMRLWRGYGINDPRGVARNRTPFLYVGTRNDRRAPLKEALRIFRRIGAVDKRTAIYPGSDHGFSLVESSRFAPRIRALILRWLSNH
jgi:pimeloyl-ACP methyl ester carboxylesterase